MTCCQKDDTPSWLRPDGEHADDERADHRAHDRAAATGQRGAAEHDRRDRVELEEARPCAGCAATSWDEMIRPTVAAQKPLIM